MQEVASTVHKYLGDGWEAEFGANNSSWEPGSTGQPSASLASAGEFPSRAFSEMNEHKDSKVSPPILKPVEVVTEREESGWRKEAESKRVVEGGEEGDTYMNVLSKRTEVEEEDDFVRSSTWTDGDPDDEYVISVEDFTGNHHKSSVGHHMEGDEQEEDGHEPNNPIYFNSSVISLHSLHSEGNHSNATKGAHPSTKSHAHALHPSRSAEGGLSPRPHKAPPKSSSNLH